MALSGAPRVHHTIVTERAWNSEVAELRIRDDRRAFVKLYAYVDGGRPDGRLSARFPHHEVTDKGHPGAANLEACTAAIAELNGGQRGAGLSRDQQRVVYRHLAAHIRDAGREPPEPVH